LEHSSTDKVGFDSKSPDERLLPAKYRGGPRTPHRAGVRSSTRRMLDYSSSPSANLGIQLYFSSYICATTPHTQGLPCERRVREFHAETQPASEFSDFVDTNNFRRPGSSAPLRYDSTPLRGHRIFAN
jgi:hypothetical protein